MYFLPKGQHNGFMATSIVWWGWSLFPECSGAIGHIRAKVGGSLLVRICPTWQIRFARLDTVHLLFPSMRAVRDVTDCWLWGSKGRVLCCKCGISCDNKNVVTYFLAMSLHGGILCACHDIAGTMRFSTWLKKMQFMSVKKMINHGDKPVGALKVHFFCNHPINF